MGTWERIFFKWPEIMGSFEERRPKEVEAMCVTWVGSPQAKRQRWFYQGPKWAGFSWSLNFSFGTDYPEACGKYSFPGLSLKESDIIGMNRAQEFDNFKINRKFCCRWVEGQSMRNASLRSLEGRNLNRKWKIDTIRVLALVCVCVCIHVPVYAWCGGGWWLCYNEAKRNYILSMVGGLMFRENCQTEDIGGW